MTTGSKSTKIKIFLVVLSIGAAGVAVRQGERRESPQQLARDQRQERLELRAPAQAVAAGRSPAGRGPGSRHTAEASGKKAAGAQIATVDLGSIGLEGSKHWDGEYVSKAAVSDCAADGAKCWEYKLTLAEAGWRLRVALDTLLVGVRYFADTLPEAPGVHFRLQVFDPSGALKAESDWP